MPDSAFPSPQPQDLTLVKWLGGLLLAALGSLLGIIYNKHERDLERLQDKMDQKADKADTDKRLDRGSEKFDEMLELLREVKDVQTAMNGHLLGELASRPTREEVRTMLQSSRQ